MIDIFSEHFARRKNIFTRIDARIKIIFVILGLIVVMSTHTPFFSFITGFFIFLSLLNEEVPFKLLILRLSAPLGIAATVLFIKIFIFHQSPAEVILLVSKIIGSTSLVLFLSMTTTIDKILAACRWFKLSGIWVQICLVTYRYIFVLLEDAFAVFQAQKARLGYTNLFRSLHSAGILAGMTFIRAYDQSVATYEAMVLRGYGKDT